MLPTNSWRVEFDEQYLITSQVINQFSRSLVRVEVNSGDRIPSILELDVSGIWTVSKIHG